MWGTFGKAAELLASEGLSSVKESNWIMRGYKTGVGGRACGLNTLQNRLIVEGNVLSWKYSSVKIMSLFSVTVRAGTAVNRRQRHSANGGT